MTVYNICFAIDNKYAQHLGVTIVSILKTNPNNNFHFYVLDGGINDKNKKKLKALQKVKEFNINFIPMDTNEFKDCPIPPESHFAPANFFRFKICSLFPKVEKILYLDCDLVVLKNLKPLFETDLSGYWMAMVPDYFSSKIAMERNFSERPYYNSGVLLFNLTECRKHNVEKKLFDYALSHPDLPYVDQDVFNAVAGDHTLTLPDIYNRQFQSYFVWQGNILLESINDTVILHYVSGQKPWNISTLHPLHQYYFTFLKYTPWKWGSKKHLIKILKLSLFQRIKTQKTKKYKICGVTFFKKTKKKDYSTKIFLFGIPVWKTRPDKWHQKYDELMQEENLYKTDIDALKKQLEALEAIKLLKKVKDDKYSI